MSSASRSVARTGAKTPICRESGSANWKGGFGPLSFYPCLRTVLVQFLLDQLQADHEVEDTLDVVSRGARGDVLHDARFAYQLLIPNIQRINIMPSVLNDLAIPALRHRLKYLGHVRLGFK